MLYLVNLIVGKFRLHHFLIFLGAMSALLFQSVLTTLSVVRLTSTVPNFLNAWCEFEIKVFYYQVIGKLSTSSCFLFWHRKHWLNFIGCKALWHFETFLNLYLSKSLLKTKQKELSVNLVFTSCFSSAYCYSFYLRDTPS